MMLMVSPANTKIIVKAIIEHQKSIIGPLAEEQANKVTGLSIDDQGTVTITTKDNNALLEQLVRGYEHLFGKASVEACKDAVKETQLSLSKDDLPAILQ